MVIWRGESHSQPKLKELCVTHEKTDNISQFPILRQICLPDFNSILHVLCDFGWKIRSNCDWLWELETQDRGYSTGNQFAVVQKTSGVKRKGDAKTKNFCTTAVTETILKVFMHYCPCRVLASVPKPDMASFESPRRVLTKIKYSWYTEKTLICRKWVLKVVSGNAIKCLLRGIR